MSSTKGRTGKEPAQQQNKSGIKRALLIVNRTSATGHSEAATDRLRSMLDSLGKGIELRSSVVDEHSQAKEQVAAFLAESNLPSLIISGGGGGTLRAVVEGICAGTKPGSLPGREIVRIATLRMGSGNVVAKQFGVPHDTEAAMQGIFANLLEDRTAPCCIMRCDVSREDAASETYFGVAMAGFGQFGRVPGDILRWRHRMHGLRNVIGRTVGIEVLNGAEYSLSFMRRFLVSAFRPGVCEVIEISSGNSTETVRLLTAVVMNFPVERLPFKPGVRIEDAALAFYAVPHPGRLKALAGLFSMKRLARGAMQIEIRGADAVELRLKNPGATEFFIDEDPAVLQESVKIEVAGTLAFVPGPDYQWPQGRKDLQ